MRPLLPIEDYAMGRLTSRGCTVTGKSFSVSQPIEVVVLNWWVTQTKNTPSPCVILKPKEIDMAKGQQRSNREAKKPKKKKIKVIAAAPSQKGAGWQPTFAEGKRK
jgi:hypothetical protein